MSATASKQKAEQDVAQFQEKIGLLREEVGKVVVGQRYMIDRILIGLLANGHCQLVTADDQRVAIADRGLAAIADGSAIDLHRVAATVDHGPAAVAVDHLGVDARDGPIGVGQHQLVVVGAPDGAAQFIEAGRDPCDGLAVEVLDGDDDHGVGNGSGDEAGIQRLRQG